MQLNHRTEDIRSRDSQFQKLLLAACILFSGSGFGLSLGGNLPLYIQSVLLICAVSHYLQKNAWTLKFSKAKSASEIRLAVFIILGTSLINFRTFAPTVTGRCILSVLIAYFLAGLYSSCRKALQDFVDIMSFFCIVSIICWACFSVFSFPTSWMPSITSASNAKVTYKTIYIYNYSESSFRNCGAFWEPSIFAGYIAAALFISRFVLDKGGKERIPLYLALLSTQSTGGIMLLALYTVVSTWEPGSNRTTSPLTKVVVVFIVSLAVVLSSQLGNMLLSINYEIFSKLVNIESNGNSLTRLNSFIVDYHIWLKSPLFGVGVAQMEVLFLQMRDTLQTITGMAHTSTSSEYVAAFGVFGMFLNWLWIKACTNMNRSIVFNVGIILAVFIILNEVSHISFIWSYFILFALLIFQDQRTRLMTKE